MIGLSVMFVAWPSFIGLSAAFDAVKMIPACENKSPHDIYFDLSNMGLRSIRKSFVSGPSIKCLNLEANDIRSLEPGAFDGLPELIYLNLATNPVSFEDFMNMSLPKLKALVLDENNNEYRYQEPKHNPSSQYYSESRYDGDTRTYYNRIDKISAIFLPSLEKLSLRNYRDESAVSTWLYYFNVPNLTHLYITGNKWGNFIPPEKLALTITHLNIDDNELNVFASNFPRLRYLSMDNNEISAICNVNCNWGSLSLRDMPHLEYLSAMQNRIESIEFDAFEDLENLQVLNVAMNRLKYLPKNLFNNMTSLKNLSLANNKFKEVPDICGLCELEILYLNGNNLTYIDSASFCDLERLKFIDLSHNSLTSISDGSFTQRPGLTVLDLSWNEITELPENWIGPNSILKVLNLDGNRFNDTLDMSLELLENLEIVSMGRNPMRNVTVRSLLTLPPNMKIDVSRVYDEI